jgi:hypothetical protein
MGTDTDGWITSYQYAWYSGPAPDGDLDTLLAWEATDAVEDTFEVMADTCCLSTEGGGFHGYTFFVRAVDNDGAMDPTPAHRSFTATTTPPEAKIVFPELAEDQRNIYVQPCVTIRWAGTDDDGQATEFRYAKKLYNELPEGEPPDQADPTKWSPWSTATTTTFQISQRDSADTCCFYVQAKDNAGGIQTDFTAGKNYIHVLIDSTRKNLPDISVSCYTGACIGPPGTQLGLTRSTLGDTTMMDQPIIVSMDEEIHFRVAFSPGQYASKVEKIQFLVDDPLEPVSWMDATRDENWCYPKGEEGMPVGLGIRTIYVWVRDDHCEFGSTRRAHITVEGVSQ